MGEKTSFFGDLKNELKQELKTDIFGFKSFKADPKESPSKKGPQTKPNLPERSTTTTNTTQSSSSSSTPQKQTREPQQISSTSLTTRDEQPERKSIEKPESSRGMFSVDLFGQSKASTLEQENQKLKNELLDTESKISVLTSTVKTLYDIRSSLEQQLEEYKNKERDERIQGISSSTTLTESVKELERIIANQEEEIKRKEEALHLAQKKNSQNKAASESISSYATNLKNVVASIFNDELEHLGNGISKDPEHEIFQEIPVSQEQMKLIEFDEFSPAKSAKQPLKSLNQEQTFYHELMEKIILAISENQPKIESVPSGDLIQINQEEEENKSQYSKAYVEGLIQQNELWKEKYRRKQEALIQQEAASNSKIDEIRQKYEEDIIFKDHELENLRKLAMNKLDEKKVNQEAIFRQTTEQLNKVTKSYQEVTAHLSQATQENSQLSSRVQSLEQELSLVDQSKMQQLENELKQKNEQISQLKANFDQAKQLLASVTAKLNALKDERNELNTRYTQLVEKQTTLEKLAASRKQDADTFSREKDAVINMYQEEVTKREKQEEDFKQELEKLSKYHSEALGAVHVQLLEVKVAHDNTLNELENHVKTIKELEEKIKGLEDEVQNQNHQIEELKAGHSHEIEALHESFAPTIQELEELKKGKFELETTNDELRNRLENFETEKKILEKRNQSLIKDLKKQLAHERKINNSDSDSSKRVSLDEDVDTDQMKEDMLNLVEKVTSLQQELMVLKRKNQSLQDNIEILKRDGEGKTKIIQDYLLREKVGKIAPSTPKDDRKDNKDKDKEKEREREKEKNSPLNPLHLTSLSSLSPLTSKKKANAQIGTTIETNKKLQSVLEETMMKNLQLQEIVKVLGEEVEALKAEKGGQK